jgi:ubiquinone/menaquinone biosynthesis C-methylase UbiE
MKHGDFTALARHYKHRSGYSDHVLRALLGMTGGLREGFRVADVGAGTGKLTEHLSRLGLRGYAVEPNGAMRREGQRAWQDSGIQWRSGSAERTGLPSRSVDWVLMGSSFHWTDAPKALKEFHRILKPGGFFTAVWNPRDLPHSPVDQRVERLIRAHVPELKRVSSGSSQVGLEDKLVATGHFHRLLFMEAPHIEVMTPARYLGIWQSVNDVRVQAGARRFADILRDIKKATAQRSTIRVAYLTRAWTVQAVE